MKKYFTLFVSITLSVVLTGQADSLKIATEQVEVVKRYEAAILQARKKKIGYQLEEREASPISYNYNVTTEKVIDFDRPDPEIRALSYKGEPKASEDLKDGYLYGAYGNYGTINAGAAYHYYIEDWLETGFKVDHFYSQDSITDDVADDLEKRFYSLDIDAYVGYYLGKQTKVTLRGLNRNLDHYRLSPVDQIGGDLALSHNVFEAKGFALRVGGSYLKTDSDQSFLGRGKQLEHKYGARMNILKSFSDNFSAELPFSYERLNGNEYEAVSDFQVEPTVRMQGQNYGLRAGLQYITGDNVSLLFPVIELKLESVVAGIDVTLSSDAEYHRNSFSFLSEVHPIHNFAMDNYSPSYTKTYGLGLDYSWQDFDFSLGCAYVEYENEVNFYDFRSQLYVFREALELNPTVSYSLNEDVKLGIDFQYHIFLTDSLNLNYKPQVQLNVHGKQSLFDNKLELVEMISFMGSREVQRREVGSGGDVFIIGRRGELPSYWDLSLRLNYRLSPSFDLFAKGTNLLGQNIVIWNNIYAHKQQIWGGIKFRL